MQLILACNYLPRAYTGQPFTLELAGRGLQLPGSCVHVRFRGGHLDALPETGTNENAGDTTSCCSLTGAMGDNGGLPMTLLMSSSAATSAAGVKGGSGGGAGACGGSGGGGFSLGARSSATASTAADAPAAADSAGLSGTPPAAKGAAPVLPQAPAAADVLQQQQPQHAPHSQLDSRLQLQPLLMGCRQPHDAAAAGGGGGGRSVAAAAEASCTFRPRQGPSAAAAAPPAAVASEGIPAAAPSAVPASAASAAGAVSPHAVESPVGGVVIGAAAVAVSLPPAILPTATGYGSAAATVRAAALPEGPALMSKGGGSSCVRMAAGARQQQVVGEGKVASAHRALPIDAVAHDVAMGGAGTIATAGCVSYNEVDGETFSRPSNSGDGWLSLQHRGGRLGAAGELSRSGGGSQRSSSGAEAASLQGSASAPPPLCGGKATAALLPSKHSSLGLISRGRSSSARELMRTATTGGGRCTGTAAAGGMQLPVSPTAAAPDGGARGLLLLGEGEVPPLSASLLRPRAGLVGRMLAPHIHQAGGGGGGGGGGVPGVARSMAALGVDDTMNDILQVGTLLAPSPRRGRRTFVAAGSADGGGAVAAAVAGARVLMPHSSGGRGGGCEASSQREWGSGDGLTAAESRGAGSATSLANPADNDDGGSRGCFMPWPAAAASIGGGSDYCRSLTGLPPTMAAAADVQTTAFAHAVALRRNTCDAAGGAGDRATAAQLPAEQPPRQHPLTSYQQWLLEQQAAAGGAVVLPETAANGDGSTAAAGVISRTLVFARAAGSRSSSAVAVAVASAAAATAAGSPACSQTSVSPSCFSTCAEEQQPAQLLPEYYSLQQPAGNVHLQHQHQSPDDEVLVLFVEPAEKPGLAMVEVESARAAPSATPAAAVTHSGGPAGRSSSRGHNPRDGIAAAVAAAARGSNASSNGSDGSSARGLQGAVAGGEMTAGVLSDWWPVVVVPEAAAQAAAELNHMLAEQGEEW